MESHALIDRPDGRRELSAVPSRGARKSYRATRFPPETILIAFHQAPTHSLRNVADYTDKIDFNETPSRLEKDRGRFNHARVDPLCSTLHKFREGDGESHQSR